MASKKNNYFEKLGVFFVKYHIRRFMSTKKARTLNPRLLSSRSGCLPDELLSRNLELNVDFVVLADLDPVDQRRDDHMLCFHAGKPTVRLIRTRLQSNYPCAVKRSHTHANVKYHP